MTATRTRSTEKVEVVVDPAVAANILTQLHGSGIDFILASDGRDGFCWYLTNPDGPQEREDWVFHALREGRADSLLDAASQLREAAVRQYPDSALAKGKRP